MHVQSSLKKSPPKKKHQLKMSLFIFFLHLAVVTAVVIVQNTHLNVVLDFLNFHFPCIGTLAANRV